MKHIMEGAGNLYRSRIQISDSDNLSITVLGATGAYIENYATAIGKNHWNVYLFEVLA